jgi:hypothetical protein
MPHAVGQPFEIDRLAREVLIEVIVTNRRTGFVARSAALDAAREDSRQGAQRPHTMPADLEADRVHQLVANEELHELRSIGTGTSSDAFMRRNSFQSDCDTVYLHRA